ncbi:hypothetical protein VP1G_04346 [Cytospora mali]|uniref:Uncharacterized protein n=1 Tax=Cytospora mali TaxID=578113 RepID=A0A194UZJ8_CYTMA|nr:hypothetical protein VP1G_04346 [Valsa mali var. pyri (nom. inval.)]
MVLIKKQSRRSGRGEVEDNGPDISPVHELQIHIQLDQLSQQGNGNDVDDREKVTTPLNTEPPQARKTNHVVGFSKESPILQPKTGECCYIEEAFAKIQSEDGESHTKVAWLLMFMGMTMLLGYKTPEAIALRRKDPGQVAGVGGDPGA